MWRIYTLLRREGCKDNHKCVHCIYKEEGLNLRSKQERKRSAAHRLERPELSNLHQCRSMDFVWDQSGGRTFRALTVEDNLGRYSHAISIGQSIKGIDVVAVMNRLKEEGG